MCLVLCESTGLFDTAAQLVTPRGFALGILLLRRLGARSQTRHLNETLHKIEQDALSAVGAPVCERETEKERVRKRKEKRECAVLCASVESDGLSAALVCIRVCACVVCVQI